VLDRRRVSPGVILSREMSRSTRVSYLGLIVIVIVAVVDF